MQRLPQRVQTTPEQLHELLQLRQQVYKESLVSGFLFDPTAAIDTDVFDHQSEFFGLYEQDSGKKAPHWGPKSRTPRADWRCQTIFA